MNTKETMKKYYQNNKEQRLNYSKQYYIKNIEARKAYSRDYWIKHKDILTQKQKLRNMQKRYRLNLKEEEEKIKIILNEIILYFK